MRRLAATLGAALVLAMGPSATAAADDMVTTVRDTAGSVLLGITVDGLYPTDVREHTVFIDIAPTVATGTAAVVVEGVLDQENGCNDPEIDDGDLTCGNDQGELSSQLQMTVTPGRTTGGLTPGCAADAAVPATTGTLASLQGQVIEVGEASAVLGRSVCFVLRQELPDQADNNLTQTDHATYDLRILGGLATDPDSTIVLPGPVIDGDQDVRSGEGEGRERIQAQRGAARSVASAAAPLPPSMASTGAATLLLIITAAATLLTGVHVRRRAQSGGPWSTGAAQPSK